MVLSLYGFGGGRFIPINCCSFSAGNHVTDCPDDLGEPLMQVRIVGYRLAVIGQGEQVPERHTVLVTGAQNDRDDPAFPLFVPF